MKTFSIITLGCKVNQYESQQIRQLLEQFGLDQVKTTNKPDLVVINICCVTHTASAKSQQYIRKTQKLSPKATIVVLGCLESTKFDELKSKNKKVHFLKNRDRVAGEIGRIVFDSTSSANYLDSQYYQSTLDIPIKPKTDVEIKYKKPPERSKLPQLTSFKDHTRAFLKVQGGCDGYCTYCIVPKMRPDVHSKSIEEVAKEAQMLVKAGHKEIVITGIFLGAFGQASVRRRKWAEKTNRHLIDLLDEWAGIPGLERIRLSSLEPGDVTEELVDVFCRHRNIMPHLHLSLQSGSDAILKKMVRQYDSSEFRAKIGLVKRRLDRCAITTDIIVGFPGETEGDFLQTVELAKEVGFAKMHIFPFSPREGTVAAKMQGAVNKEVIKKRSQVMRQLDSELGFEFRGKFIGEEITILTENDGKIGSGRSERYFIVYFNNEEKKYKKNELIKVKLLENRGDGVIGEVVGRLDVKMGKVK